MMKIPIFQVTVSEYKLKTFRKVSKEINSWYGVKIPKVYFENKPDFKQIGFKIDTCLKRHVLGKKVAIRALSSEEHKGKSISDLIKIIKKNGSDRYNSNRKGDRYENVDNYHIDFFALDYKITKNGAYFENLIEPFYFWPIVDRGKPIRLDLAIIYDLKKLKRIEHRYKGRENELKKDGFVFKDPEKKTEAILGIIKIL